MATSNVTPTLDLLGKQIELLERSPGRIARYSGQVLAVVIAAPGAKVSEAVLIGTDHRAEFHHLDDCEIVSVQ